MSYFVLGVGGTGAKLLQTLVHLAAAGLPADRSRGLDCLLVDPDDANGNVDDCKKLVSAYLRCKALKTGDCDLFNRSFELRGPWTPLGKHPADTLNEMFQFTQRQQSAPLESQLMELFFTEEERNMKIHQGFRGRPAIGAAVLSSAIDFADENEPWKRLVDKAKAAGNFDSGVPVLLAGSVFGGSGAAGVPTILQLLRKPLSDSLNNVRLGLILFLPYFTFKEIPGELIQAVPADFDHATVEALKYYAERGFLDKCHSVYAVGEQFRAELPVSAVGSAAQRNEPHFLELVAGFGALRFFDEGARTDEEHSLSIAGRRDPFTLTWDDLPTIRHDDALTGKLQRMIQFAVAFHLSFYPFIKKELSASRDSKNSILQKYIFRERLSKDEAQRELDQVEDYVVLFLTWLLRISKPRIEGFKSGLVDVNVFAVEKTPHEWELRSAFRKESDFRDLFVNAPGRKQPDLNALWKRTEHIDVTDPAAARTGRLLRAIYDSCE